MVRRRKTDWVQPEESAYDWKGKPKIQLPEDPKKRREDLPAVVDLFCGAGGISAGLSMAGFDIVLGIDIHEPSIQTFRENHPGAATILGDMRKVTKRMIKKALPRSDVTLATAGIPCEGFSISSKKRSDHDERNYLFERFLWAVEVINPDYILLENVPTMASAGEGEFVKDIERSLRGKVEGYDLNFVVERKTLDAQDFGVPQMRERLFFLGAKPEHPLVWPSYLRERKEPPTVWEAISDLPKLDPYEKSDEYDEKQDRTEYQKTMRRGCEKGELHNHEAPKHQTATIDRIKNTPPGEPMYQSFTQRVRLKPDEPSPTLVAGGIRPQFMMGHPYKNRGLTPRERARLQSFPDWYKFKGGIVQSRVLTGDAVPPLLSKAFGKAIKLALNAEKFRKDLIKWGGENLRDFPWRDPKRTPYEILIAEMLLRKTRAESVERIYTQFLSRYSSPEKLVSATEGDLREFLRPLGLFRERGRAFKKLGKILMGSLGKVPDDPEKLMSLPHVGRYSANAVLCFAYGQKRPLVDRNVARVYMRIFDIEISRQLHEENGLWGFAQSLLPNEGWREFNLSLLDFGALVCLPKNPDCGSCFARSYCLKADSSVQFFF